LSAFHYLTLYMSLNITYIRQSALCVRHSAIWMSILSQTKHHTCPRLKTFFLN
jgi:hypothetical protein